MHDLTDELFSHLRASWRHRWFAVLLAWIVALGGWTAVYLTPERYEASARVYVDTQTVLRPLLAGLTVQPNVDQIVFMMSRTLISRPNLGKVIQMADMDIELKTAEEREQLITRLSRGVVIQSAGRQNLYTIAYTDKNPQRAKRVVQSLLTIFVEGNLGGQARDSDAARRFIDEQLKAYNEKLVAAETAVTEFKRRQMGFMAGDRQDYYQRLVATRSELDQATLALKEAEDSRDAVKRQLEGAEDIPSLLGGSDVDERDNPEVDGRIRALEQKLDSLRLTYTEQHPDIVAIVSMIAQLKEQRKAETKLRKPSPRPTQTQDPNFRQRTVLLATAEASVAALKARVAEYSRRYDELKAAANAVPQVEAEFTQLTRDYEVTKRNYQALLARRETAQISGEMETKANVMEFRVIDPPQVPSEPKAPNRPLLMSLVLLVALGGGFGGAILISLMRPTFDDGRRLHEVSGLQVLGTVAMAWTDAQKARRKGGLVAFLVSFVSLVSAYAAIMAALVSTASRA